MKETPPTLNDILAGQFILKRDFGGGRYTLKREIGRGGAATVYLARDERHERFVAIKVLHPELSHAIGAQRFLREIKLTASLQHPHILPIHDSGESADQLYYVMPFVEGESLRQRLSADNRLSIEEAVRIGREVAGALAYAHERGIVHRDIKPENILFSGGHAVVADFGIARAIDRASEKITQQGTITGTPAYMSPEQARDRAFDGRSDVYSLACVLYEAIAGVPPFPGDTPQQQLSARLTKMPPLLREYRHDVPAPIESVIAKALATSPDDRYPDARTFSAALSSAIGHSGETLTARAAQRAWGARRWATAAGVALVVLVGAVTPPVRDRIERLTVRVDSTQFAVVPFQYVGSAPPNPAADPAAGGVYAALKRWDGLKLASDVSVQDAVRDRGGDGALPVEAVMRVARSVRAGRVVWGRVLDRARLGGGARGSVRRAQRREPARGDADRSARRGRAATRGLSHPGGGPAARAARRRRLVDGGPRHDVVRGVADVPARRARGRAVGGGARDPDSGQRRRDRPVVSAGEPLAGAGEVVAAAPGEGVDDRVHRRRQGPRGARRARAAARRCAGCHVARRLPRRVPELRRAARSRHARRDGLARAGVVPGVRPRGGARADLSVGLGIPRQSRGGVARGDASARARARSVHCAAERLPAADRARRVQSDPARRAGRRQFSARCSSCAATRSRTCPIRSPSSG